MLYFHMKIELTEQRSNDLLE